MKTAVPPTQADQAAVVADVAAQLDASLAGLLLAIAAQFRLLGLLTIPVWNRISRARQRLARLLAQLAANNGAPLPPRPARSRQGRPGGAPAHRLPKGRLWLVAKIGYHAAGFGSQIQTLLRDPAAVAVIAASPGAARTLRPLCHMLGVDLPPELRLPPRKPRPATVKPPTPPAPATPDRPIPAYVMAAARAWKRRDSKRR